MDPDELEEFSLGWTCIEPILKKNDYLLVLMYVFREGCYLIVNVFMLKNLSVYFLFSARSDEEEAFARRKVRYFTLTYVVFLILVEGVNTYLYLFQFTIGNKPTKSIETLFLITNAIRFILNMFLVVVSFKSAY